MMFWSQSNFFRYRVNQEMESQLMLISFPFICHGLSLTQVLSPAICFFQWDHGYSFICYVKRLDHDLWSFRCYKGCLSSLICIFRWCSLFQLSNDRGKQLYTRQMITANLSKKNSNIIWFFVHHEHTQM